MRIVFVSPPPDMSGGIRVIAIYADRLQRRGHDVTIVYPPAPRPSLRKKVESFLKGQGWPDTPSLAQSHYDGVEVRRHMLDSPRPVIDQDVPDADVVISTWWETAEWVAALSRSKGAKACFLQGYETFWYLPIERVKKTWFLPFHKIVVSGWLAQIAKEDFRDPEVSVVPNSVDTEQFDAPPRGRQEVPTVGLMYDRVDFKGSDLALAAIDLAKNELPDLRVVAFGKIEPNEELPLPAKAEFFHNPPQEKIRDVYARCDAWLFPSRSEGFGLPVLEAMACRTPVIGTPAGAAPELLADDRGMLVPHDAPEEMAQAIVEIFRLEPERWQAMSNAAYAQARSYTWDDATERFEKALLRAIERRELGEL